MGLIKILVLASSFAVAVGLGASESRGRGLLDLSHARAEPNDRVEAGYGRCSRCSCPGFRGNGYTCSRGEYGHHYDSHW